MLTVFAELGHEFTGVKKLCFNSVTRMGLKPELLDEVLQSARKMKHTVVILKCLTTYQTCGCFNVALQQIG